MKKVIKKKLELNKKTIASLNNEQISQIQGARLMVTTVQDVPKCNTGQTCLDGTGFTCAAA